MVSVVYRTWPDLSAVSRLACGPDDELSEATAPQVEPPEGPRGVEGVPTGFDGEIRWRISASPYLICCKP